MKFTPSQLSLVTAILTELTKQAVEQGFPEKFPVRPDQVNAICAAATDVVKAFGLEYRPSKPAMGLAAWLNSHDTGMSSKALAHRLFGSSIPHGWKMAHPWDQADFGRCHRFLDAVPEARARLHEAADISPVWAKLVANWDALTALYNEELPSGAAPKLYAMMQTLTHE